MMSRLHLDGDHFIKVATLPASANNIQSVSYNWLDKNAQTGLYYYRIKSTDSNSKMSYSKTVQFLINDTGTTPEIIAYGN